MSMIYAVSEFTDEKDTDWKVQIVDADSVSSDLNYPFNLGPDGFRISYGYDNFDRSKPILGSKLMITLFHPETNSAAFDALYTALDTTEEGTYRVEVYRDPDGDNEVWWVGSILPEQTIIPDEFPHAAVSITAVDGLANLKGIKYNNDGTAYSGTDLITTHLYKALSKVHAANFWGSSDILLRFYEDFISAQYKAWIGTAQNKQLENAKIEHSTFLNTNSDGVHEYYSAFEVLESIALSLNASIFMAKGSFWLVPLGATQSHVQNNLDIWNQITGNGTVTYNTSTNLTDYDVAFGSNNAIYEKLKGWERSSTPAFKEVKRVRNYQGDMPLISRSYYNLDRVSNSLATGATLEDEDAVQPSGRAYKLIGNFQFFTSGISSLTGQDAVLRPRIRFKIKVGDAGGTVNYLKRDDSYDSSAVATAVWYNDTFADGYTYRTPQYSTDVWNSTSSNRLTWVAPYAFNGNNGGASFPQTQSSQFYHGELFDITLPEIPAEATGLQITATLDFINWAGNAVTAVDFFSPTAVVATWKFTQFSIRVLEDEDIQEFGEVDIVATNEDTARYVFNQEQTLIGDKISEGSLGVININDGAPGGVGYTPATYWNNSQDTTSTNLSINGLGVRERLGANKKARRTERGTLYRTGALFIHPYSVLINTEDSNNFYQLTGLNFIASTGEYDIECIYLLRNITGITVANLDDRPSKGPGETGLPPDGVYQNKGPVDDTIQGENVTKLGFITTDTYGITKVTTSTGGAGIDINLPITKASAGVELVSINTVGSMGPVADGSSGEFLKTNGSGVLSWAAAGGGGGGYFGSTTLLKVMPTEFFMNDDYTRAPLAVEDDTTDVLGVRAPSTLAELYAFIPIPTGYKATYCRVYASTSTSSAVIVKSFNQTTGATGDKGTGDFNTLIDITDISSSTTQNIVIKASPASVSTVIYGADIVIAAV